MKLLPLFISLLSGLGAVAAAISRNVALRPNTQIQVSLQTRVRDSADGPFRIVAKPESWNPTETAIIVCDMWNSHSFKYAAQRVAELAPRLNEVLETARTQGVFIVHAPSNCM